MITHEASNGGADFVSTLLSPSLLKALDRYIREEAPGQTRSDALREAFKQWCVDRGYIQPNDIDPSVS